MKTKLFICSLVILSVVCTNSKVQAQTIEKSRIVIKSFVLDPDAEVEITNKYGNIHLIPWEKDSVRFEIEILVRGTKQSKVDKSFDYIEIDFKESKYYVIAQTLFAGKSSFWSDVSDLTGAIFSGSTKTKIDYTVYIPSEANLNIKNKFGNIYTTDHTGPLEIDLSNGNLKAHYLSGKTKITTEFGDADIRKIDYGQLRINYGELRLEGGGEIDLESKSSEFYLSYIESLSLNSKRDQFYIDTVGNLKGNTYFSLIQIDRLNSGLNLATKYGDVDIKNFSDDFESFNLKTNDTDVTLHFTDDKYYKLNIITDKETEVYYSAEIENITSEKLEGEEKLIQVTCQTGSDKSKTVPLEINSRGGNLSLKLK